MRSLTTGLIVLASLSLASCNRGVVNPPMATGLLELTLTPATITKCQSVVLNDPFKTNGNLTGASFVEVRAKGTFPAVGRYPNPTSRTAELTRAGDYEISYMIQNPQYPEKLSLTFRCTTGGAESTQVFTITGTGMKQPVNLSF